MEHYCRRRFSNLKNSVKITQLNFLKSVLFCFQSLRNLLQICNGSNFDTYGGDSRTRKEHSDGIVNRVSVHYFGHPSCRNKRNTEQVVRRCRCLYCVCWTKCVVRNKMHLTSQSSLFYVASHCNILVRIMQANSKNNL